MSDLSYEPRVGTIGADAEADTTTIIVREGTPGARIEDFAEGDIVRVLRTGEMLCVLEVDVPCSSLTVKRAIVPGTEPLPVRAGDEAFIVGMVPQ